MWQDWYFAAAGLVYSAVMIPSCRDRKTEIPRRSSVLTAVALSCSAVAYATLGMWMASGSCAIGAGVWSFLGRYRPIRSIVSENAAGEVLVEMPLTEKEALLVEQFRLVMAQGMQQGGTVGGCGGCPSAGECPSESV
jgi:hypothetical protein